MKPMRTTFAALATTALIPASVLNLGAQTWTLTSAPITNWQSVACSADGGKMFATVNGGPIYISTDAGGTWAATTAPVTNWTCVACSADGSKIFAGARVGQFVGGLIYCSTNSGATWVATTAEVQPWLSIACSADGEEVIAAWWDGSRITAGDTTLSTNGGVSWQWVANYSCGAVASTTDGNTLVSGRVYGMYTGIDVSTNSFLTHTESEFQYYGEPNSIALSVDGLKMVISKINSAIFTSTNRGTTLELSSAPVTNWSCVAASAKADRLVATVLGGGIYSSTDLGATWTLNSAPITNWSSVASSADGNKLVAVVNGGGIYTWQSASTVPGTVLWVYDAGTGIAKSPALGPDGTVYLDLGYGGLCAITNSGSKAGKKWTFPKGGRTDSSPSAIDATISIGVDGTVYVGCPDGNLYAVSPDGSQKWAYYTGGGGGTPAIGLDNTIYFNGYGAIYAISPAGTLKWKASYGGSGAWSSPAIGPDGTVYVSFWESGTLEALNSDGTRKWLVDAQYPSFWACPAIDADGTIYVTADGFATASGHLYAFSPNGSRLWSSASDDFGPASPAIGEDGTVYDAKWLAGCLCAFNPNGEQLSSALCFNFGTNMAPTTPAIDSAGTLYYSASNSIIATTPDGNVKWSIYDGSAYEVQGTSPAIGPEGTIYATLGAKLYAIAGTNALANAPWPMCGRNPRHTGSVERPFFRLGQSRPDGAFQYSFYGHLGQTYALQVSTNLTSWTVLTNIAISTVPMTVVDTAAAGSPARFYRAVSQ